jgi:hypothetical protein
MRAADNMSVIPVWTAKSDSRRISVGC